MNPLKFSIIGGMETVSLKWDVTKKWDDGFGL